MGVESRPVERSRSGDDVTAADEAASRNRERPRREISRLDRLVRIPLGFLWLIVLAIVAVPVTIVMTLLYYLTRFGQALARLIRARRPRAGGGEERVA